DATTADRSPYVVEIGNLVTRFGTTDHRRQLLRGLLSYRQLLANDGYEDGLQFVDGSFVEDLETTKARNPTDIDVFSLLRAPEKYRADPALWDSKGKTYWTTEITDRDRNRQRFSLDTYAVLIDGVQ